MSKMRIRYGDYLIHHDPPPIPDRSHDWHFEHQDYDGAPLETGGPPADKRAGSGASPIDCMRQIDELVLEGEG